MKKDAAGYPSLPLHYGLTNPGISRYLVSRLPYIQSGSEGGGGNGALWPPRRPPTLLESAAGEASKMSDSKSEIVVYSAFGE